MEFLEKLYNTFVENSSKNCLCDEEQFFTYQQLLDSIAQIREAIRKNVSDHQKNIGLVAHTDIYTYAAIFAMWFEGKTYVPLLPTAPEERNQTVCKEAKLSHIFTSKDLKQSLPVAQILTSELNGQGVTGAPITTNNSAVAYILFTSGTTGVPKGVQITLGNLNAFIGAMWALGHGITNNDRVLQMFELTFDFSVVSYLLPLYGGACIYTIPAGEVKYSYVLDLLEMHHLTVLFLVPSVITYLQMFFDDIHETDTRLCSFCGEALLLDITNRWQKCIPNARIINFYGPTEDTVFCSYYDVNSEHQKNLNDVISIGRPMKDGTMLILNEDGIEVGAEERGELCLAGPQLSPGYWDNPERNSESFFEKDGKRFYKTGDLCFKDAESDFMYVGRIDFQAKIQGFRVELSEVEHYVLEALPQGEICACVAFTNKMGNTEIGLALQGETRDYQPILDHVKEKLPPYEIPTKVMFIKQFPLNTNGKLDRKAITKSFEQ